MRKLIFALVVCMTVGLFAAPSHAGKKVNNLNEPGSLLAYPLIDNIHGVTIVNIANTCSTPEVVECYMVTHGPDGGIDEKKDFVVHLSPKEKFVWVSNNPIDKSLAGKRTQVQGFDDRKGYMFCFMINDQWEQKEVGGDCLKGDATVLDVGKASAFNYNAIPHQRPATSIVSGCGDYTLCLDGYEYTRATSQVMFEGLAAVPGAIHGILAVASPGIDFVLSEQPKFDINVYCWNEVETKFSRHLEFEDFEQYDLTEDLQLDIASIFTLGWQCATTSTHPLWAVMHQCLGTVFGWGGNVFQHPGAGADAKIKLSAPPM